MLEDIAIISLASIASGVKNTSDFWRILQREEKQFSIMNHKESFPYAKAFSAGISPNKNNKAAHSTSLIFSTFTGYSGHIFVRFYPYFWFNI